MNLLGIRRRGSLVSAGMSDPISDSPRDPLGIVPEALARVGETNALAARHLDPSLVEMLRVIGFDRRYVTAQGSWLYDTEGRANLDFHTGEGFASLGHNHPEVRAVLEATLAAELADGVQIHYSVLAGMLAQELTARLPESLSATFFGSTGAEVVDSAMKFARAATGRPRLISCDGGYHGVTLGPLSLVGDDFFQEGFGPLLPGCDRVPFGDLDALEAQLRRRDVAAFITEPIQGNLVNVPSEGYLRGVQELCRRYGTLFILDEVQTGLGRTGTWFARERWDVEPDFITIGKALSGGYMPVAAMVTRREIFQKAVGTLERCFVHQSTYGRNRLSMAAGLASVRIIERDGLVDNAERMGTLLRDGLRELQERYELIADVRGHGLITGIELKAPSDRVGRINWRLFHLASGGLFPQLIVIPLHRDHNVITMVGGKNDVIKLLPALTVSEAEVNRFLEAFDAVLADVHSSASRNWGVVRDIATATISGRLRDHAGTGPGERPPGTGGAGAAVNGGAGVAVNGGAGVAANGGAGGATVVARSMQDACLVTGASGFIGGHLVQRLASEGHHVRCLVRPSSDTSLLRSLGVELVHGDLTDARSLADAVQGCRYVLHCGALVSDWGTEQEIRAINVIGTRDLARAAATASVDRFVHLSSTDVYGYPGGLAVDETHVGTGFANWYSQTKRDAETEIRGVPGLDAVILRPSTIYGPRSVDVVGDIARAIRGRHMLLIDRGRATAGLCYVENLIDAAVLALRLDAAAGETFNITDGVPVTWRQFTDGLAAGLGAAP